MLKATFFVEIPSELLIEYFNMSLELNCSLLHNSMHLLCLLEPFNCCILQLGLNVLLRQVDAHFLFVYTQNFHHLLLADLQELIDRLHTLVSHL